MFPSCDYSFCSFRGKLAKNHQISWNVSVSFLKGGPEAVVMHFKPVSPGGECLLIANTEYVTYALELQPPCRVFIYSKLPPYQFQLLFSYNKPTIITL